MTYPATFAFAHCVALLLAPTLTQAAEITINAHGTALDGVYAHFRVLVNGSFIGEGTAGAIAADHVLTSPLAREDIREVLVHFDNDAADGDEDRNLSVHAVSVDGRLSASTAANVTYDRGQLDGIDTRAGQVLMPWGGYLVYKFRKLTPSAPLVFSDRDDVKVSGVRITNPNGPCIVVNNAVNVVIEQSEIGPCAGAGISLYKVHNAKVRQNFIGDAHAGVLAGVVALESTRVDVNHNQFLNMNGPIPRGQAVLFDKVKGGGNRIRYNHAQTFDSPHVTRLPEDTINVYESEGLDQDPILVTHNYIRAGVGAASESGCGINLGDSGGRNARALHNVLVNPGQVGICIPAGQYNKVADNKIYASAQPFTNVGIYVQNRYAKPPTPELCSDHTVARNHVWWQRRDGMLNSHFFATGDTACPNLKVIDNTWDSLLVSETMAPPQGAGVTKP
jgi:hypothetical protein